MVNGRFSFFCALHLISYIAMQRPTYEYPNSVPRSLSTGIFGQQLRKPQAPLTDDESNLRVHPISSDLWEAITGERLSPAIICDLCNNSMGSCTHNVEVNNQYVVMARDRLGSRLLQEKLQETSEAERNVIIDSLLPKLDELVSDPSANYVVQKVIDYATDERRQTIFCKFFLANVEAVIEHQNACRVLQKFIEQASREHVEKIYLSLRESVVPLCSSSNGNHIIQGFIDFLPDYIPEIIDMITPDVNDLVVDNCGCRVVQKLFDKVEISRLQSLVVQVLRVAPSLAMNQYGNYVIQNILESGSDRDIEALLEAFRGHFYEFSSHKFASNVIEKCIKRSNREQKAAIFAEVIGCDGHFDGRRIMRLVGDQFGNYVIQRILEYGTEDQVEAIGDVVYDNYSELVKRPYSKHVILRLQNQHRYQFCM